MLCELCQNRASTLIRSRMKRAYLSVKNKIKKTKCFKNSALLALLPAFQHLHWKARSQPMLRLNLEPWWKLQHLRVGSHPTSKSLTAWT